MTVSPAIRAALETARHALAEIVAAAPDREPHYRDYVDREDEWGRGCANWDRANTARPALQIVRATLAEMDA